MKIKVWSSIVAAGLLLSVAACSGSSSDTNANSPADPTKVSGDITVLTNRTDMVNDGRMKKYSAEFNKVYPNVKVTFQGVTDYEGEVKIRLNSSNYGDVLLIPGALTKTDYPKFFESLGSATDLASKYRFVANAAVDGKVYGIAQNGNANGFVYNKAVWAQAGITAWPTTPEEFLTDLAAIKSKTAATPLYTNYHDGWPLTKYQDVLGSISCDAKANDALATNTAPWAPGSELNAIDTVLYNVVHNKLTETDPTTTNWENSKSLIGTGKIATMWLGSWAVSQMKAAATAAGAKPDDIGFMPWPSKKSGSFCSVVGPDYLQAVSIHSKNKPAARAWLDWFTDTSTYAQDEGLMSPVKTAQLPPNLKPYQDAGVQLVELTQDKLATVSKIDNESEIGLQKPDYRQHIVDLARGAASGSLEAYFAELNKKWSTAIQTAGS